MTQKHKPVLVEDFSKLKKGDIVCYGNPEKLDTFSGFRYCIVSSVYKPYRRYKVWGCWQDSLGLVSIKGHNKTYFQEPFKNYRTNRLYLLDKVIDKEYENLWV